MGIEKNGQFDRVDGVSMEEALEKVKGRSTFLRHSKRE